MGKRRATALAEVREPTLTESQNSNSTAPSQERPQKPWRVAMLLWGLPLIFFVTVAVLKECVGVTF